MAASPALTPALPLHEQPAIHARRWFLLGIMCLSLVLVVMSVSGLNTALPTMQRDLGASASELQWIVDSYAVVFAGLLLSAGAIGDRFGRRGALLAGLAVFGVGSLLGGLASDASQLIASRAVMGIGAAFIMPATLSIITSIFPPEERPRAIAIWAGFAGAGASIGPIVTGGLLEGFWWGSTVLVSVPVVLAIVAAVWAYAPDSRDETKTPLDPVGALLSLVGLSSLIFGIIQGPEDGWTGGTVIAAFLVAGAALSLFVAWERRSDHPMLPLTLFRDRRFSTGSGVITVAFFVMFGFFFLSTQYLQFGRGYSPLEAGLAGLPIALAFVAFSPQSAALAGRYGAPRVMALGLAIVAAGFAMLTGLTTDTPYPVLAVAFTLLGAGMSITAAPATSEIMTSVPLAKAGVGSAVNDTTRELGGALGIALLGSIANTAYRSGVELDGTRLPAGARAAAEESIGAANAIGARVPGGSEVVAQAASAFSDAFTLTNAVAVGIALAAAGAVLAFSRRRGDDEVHDVDIDVDIDVDVDVDQLAVTAGYVRE
ncbi:MAG TPA: MFS transporter [Acidimicrobiales bacterium]|nr:MFS transporter [Acidimicrobiales bacterium]